MNKIKAFNPSMREKRRYLLIESKNEDYKNLKESLYKLTGIIGLSESNLQLVKYLENNKEEINKKKFLVRINPKYVDKLRASIVILNKDFKIIKIYGSIKKFEKEIIRKLNNKI